MQKKKVKKASLEITVSRSWPLNRLKKVNVKIIDDSLYSRNEIALDKSQTEDLLVALDGILSGGDPEDIVS